MAIYFYNIKIPFTAREEDAVEKAAKIADIPQSEIKLGYVVKTSLDACKQDAIFWLIKEKQNSMLCRFFPKKQKFK